MLSIGIKNSILVLLIVLILHFLLKNLILERKPIALQETKKVESFHSVPETTPTAVLSKDDICRNVRLSDAQKKKLEQEEMMRYVAMGDDDNGKNLDKFFQDNIVSNDVKELESRLESDNVCKFKADNQQLPMSSTCNAEIQQLPLANDMRIKADCNLKQDKKNIMILTEYEDEKDMNGGTLFGGLSAFDNFDVEYQPYSCASVDKN
jgi:hypothetical protein